MAKRRANSFSPFSSARRFAVTCLRRLERAFDGFGTFVADGVRVTSVGGLLDQPSAAAVIAEAKAQLEMTHQGRSVVAVLRRLNVKVQPDYYVRDGVPFEIHAEWSGGLLDQGHIHLRVAESEVWKAQLKEALVSLVTIEMSEPRP